MTDDTLLPVDLPSVERKKLTVDFNGGNQSSDVGLLLLREAERQLGVCRRLAEAMPDRRDPEVSDMLTRRFDTIVIEDLAVKNMVRNHRLALAISDAGFGMLGRMIEYKAVLRGCRVAIAPRFFPSSKTCSECGVIKDTLSLDERVFRREECGYEIAT